MRKIQSNKFRFIGKNLLDLINNAPPSQNFCRLIAYTTDDPFSAEALDRNNNLKIQSDINFYDLMDNQFIIGQVDTTIVKDLKVIVFLHPYLGKFPIQNSTSDETFVLDIIYPHIYYVLRGQGNTRPELIGAEFFENIDRSNVTGTQKILVSGYKETPLDIQDYGILSCFFTISNSNIKP